MRFKGLDLNLLVALDALIETRSVSRSAERMNLSQPAMSSALGRLRHYFRDDILVAHGKRMYPTAFAESLLPLIRESLRGIDALISTSTTFDPVTSQRTFRLAASDYITASVVVPLVALLADIAPRVRIDINLPSEHSIQQLAEGKIDLLLTPEEFISRDHPADFLFEERHVVVGWDKNPLFKHPISERDFMNSGHVAVSFGAHRSASFADRQLEALGKARRVDVTAASFTIVPWLLRDTMRLALMHERLAHAMVGLFPIAFGPIPFEFPLMREMAQYHQARTTDEGLCWFRRELLGVAAAAKVHKRKR